MLLLPSLLLLLKMPILLSPLFGSFIAENALSMCHLVVTVFGNSHSLFYARLELFRKVNIFCATVNIFAQKSILLSKSSHFCKSHHFCAKVNILARKTISFRKSQHFCSKVNISGQSVNMWLCYCYPLAPGGPSYCST